MTAHKINIVLVGRTGNGKSSTGYTILGQKLFGGDDTNQTDPIDSAMGELCGVPIQVIDSSGIGDSVEDINENNVKMIDSIDYLSKRLPPQTECDDFGILVLVLMFNTRFTEQEKRAVSDIRRLFGEDCLQKFGIILFTYGDLFDNESGDFKTWCASQTGEFKALYNECNQRSVLFDNKTNDNNTKQRQLEHLFSLVEEIRSSSGHECLKIDEDGKRALIEEHAFPEIQRNIEKKLLKRNEIMCQMETKSRIGFDKLGSEMKKLQDMEKLLNRLSLSPMFNPRLMVNLDNLMERNNKRRQREIRSIFKQTLFWVTIILLAVVAAVLLVYFFARY